MSLEALARILRMNNIFAPTDIMVEGGWPGGPVTMKNPSGVGINDDWSWIHGSGDKNAPKANIGANSMQKNESDIRGVLDQLYTPDTTYSDMYRQTLSEMPQRPKPRIMNKIAGSLLGLSGDMKGAEHALYGDYDTRLSDWENKMKFLQPGMQYERYANSNERSNAYQTAQTVLRERQLAQQAERDRQANEAREYANQIRAQVAKGGQVVTDDKTHETFMVYKDGTKTPIDITKLSQADLEEARQSNRLQLEGERQDNRLELEKMREASREEILNMRNDVQMEMMRQRAELAGQNKWSTPVQAFDKDSKPLPFLVSTNGVTGEVKKIPLDDAYIRTVSPGSGTGAASVQSETQKAQGITNKARQVATEFPGYANYIQFDKQGRFIGLKKPSLWMPNRPDQAGYEDMYQKIYGEPLTVTPVSPKGTSTAKPTPPKGTSSTPPAKAPATTANTAPAGKVKVVNPNGQTGYIPEAQLQEALKQGYKKAQ